MGPAIGIIIVFGVLFLLSGLKVLNEYERAVVFRLGRLTPYRGPGVIFVIPILERDGADRSAHRDARHPAAGRHHPRQRDRSR